MYICLKTFWVALIFIHNPYNSLSLAALRAQAHTETHTNAHTLTQNSFLSNKHSFFFLHFLCNAIIQCYYFFLYAWLSETRWGKSAKGLLVPSLFSTQKCCFFVNFRYKTHWLLYFYGVKGNYYYNSLQKYQKLCKEYVLKHSYLHHFK